MKAEAQGHWSVSVLATLLVACLVANATDASGGNISRAALSQSEEEDLPLSSFHLVGDATLSSERIRLADAQYFRSGAAWWPTQLDVAQNFAQTFSFEMSQPRGDADGLVWMIQNDSLEALGEDGGGLGYSGIPNSIAVEFDTFRNYEGDVGISVHTGGSGPNSSGESSSLGSAPLPYRVSDGAIHDVRVEYISGILDVYLDGQRVLSVAIDVADTIDLSDGKAWVGFTAATGASWQNHDILNVAHKSNPAQVSKGRYRIEVRSFIPGDHVRSGGLTCRLRPMFFSGDDRRFSPDPARYRTQQRLVVTPATSRDADGEIEGTYDASTGMTRLYAKNALRDGVIDNRDNDGQLRDCHLLHREKRLCKNGCGEYFNKDVDRFPPGGPENAVITTLSGHAKNPLHRLACSIDYRLQLMIVQHAEGGADSYSLSISHDGFPAYEVYVNDRLVYKYHPGGQSPYRLRQVKKLCPPKDISEDRSGDL